MVEREAHIKRRNLLWLSAIFIFASLLIFSAYLFLSFQSGQSKITERRAEKTNAIKGQVWMERATKAHNADDHDKEFELLLKSAQFNYLPAILKISKNYETGNYVHQSDLKSKEWASKLPETQYIKFLVRRGLDLTASGQSAEKMALGLTFLEEGLEVTNTPPQKDRILERMAWLYHRGDESFRDVTKAQIIYKDIGGEALANFYGYEGFAAQELGNNEKARRYYQKAIDLGSDRAKIILAYNYRDDHEGEEHFETADSLALEATKSQDKNVQYDAALYFIDRHFNHKKSIGLDLMETLANEGFNRSRSYLADYFTDNPNVDADYERAAKYIEAMTYIPAKMKVTLGHLKRTGIGTPQDISGAFKLYEKASAENYDPAKMAMAHMYRLGLGTPRNPEKAKELYESIKYDNRSPASYYIGLLYESGDIPSKTMQQAIELYTFAAEDEYGPALEHLAKLYEAGQHIPKDPKKAFALMTEAAYTSHPTAIENLARYYSEGIGTEHNSEYATIWRSKMEPPSPFIFLE